MLALYWPHLTATYKLGLNKKKGGGEDILNIKYCFKIYEHKVKQFYIYIEPILI